MFKKEDSILEDYNIASRNSQAYKFIKNQHLVHYKDDIIKLNEDLLNISGEEFFLPEASDFSEYTFDQVLFNRKSSRDFKGLRLDSSKISDILFYSLGCKSLLNNRKFVAQSGGLNSVEAFVFIQSAENISSGLYFYNSKNHSLVLKKHGNFSTWFREHVFYQTEYADASMIIMLTSNQGKLNKKYGLRAYRLSLLDVGHVSQNIYLICSALKLDICASAGFIDDEVNDALDIDGLNISTFLTVMVG